MTNGTTLALLGGGALLGWWLLRDKEEKIRPSPVRNLNLGSGPNINTGAIQPNTNQNAVFTDANGNVTGSGTISFNPPSTTQNNAPPGGQAGGGGLLL